MSTPAEWSTVLTTGSAAPDFSLSELSGRAVRLQEALQEGPVVLAFFRHNCPASQLALPFVERLHQAYGPEARFFGISQDSEEDTARFCKEFGIRFPVLLDAPEFVATRSYRVSIVPSIVLLEPQGRVVYSFESFQRRAFERLSEELAALLKRPPIAVFQPGDNVPEVRPG